MKYIKAFLYTTSIIILGTLITTILYYFNVTSEKINSILLYLVSIISILTGSIIFNKIGKQKTIIGGLLYFIIWAFIYVFISLIFYKGSLSVKSLPYYFILLVFSVLGSLIGKAIKEKSND